MNKNFKFIDLFCGLGGFRLALEPCGGACVFSSDFNAHIQDTYEANFGERPFGDVTDVNVRDIPPFDVLTAGFPCQPFSISGHKRGFADTRGTLFFEVCRIIKECQPKVVILENVKHLIHHNKKKTFKTIISALQGLGYLVNYRLLNAIDFGLPQNRERIFIIATKTNFFDFDRLRKKSSEPLKNFLDTNGNHEYLNPEEYTLLEDGVFKTQPNSGLIFRGYRNKNGFKKGIRPNTLHLNRVHRQPNRIYSVDGNHPTLPSQETSGRFFIYEPDKNRVRKLTINECFRIMGFPEDYKRISPYGEQYKQIGNSVAVPVVFSIMQAIIDQGLLTNAQPQDKIAGIDIKGAGNQLELAV